MTTYEPKWLCSKYRESSGCKVFVGVNPPELAKEGDIWWLDRAILLRKGQDWILDGISESYNEEEE